MSLNQKALKDNLLSVFQKMTDGDDSYFAKQVSAKIADYVESVSITTVDAGSVSAGVFAGSGIGSISVDSTVCEKIVNAACETMVNMTTGGDDHLAEKLANGINTMMLAGKVNASVTGTVTSPSGVASPLAGKAKGTFTGVSATLQSGFSAAFTAMQNMSENGNSYLAGEIAQAVTEYLKAGMISTQGQEALSGSVGTGSIS